MDGFTYHNIFETKGVEYLIIIAFLLMIIPFWIAIDRELPLGARVRSAVRTFTEGMLRVPLGLLFSRNHTWTYLDKSGLAEVGIDDFLVHMAGDMKLASLGEEGKIVRKGDLLAELVHQGKKLRVYSPVSGRIASVNGLMSSAPSVLGEDPYNRGWICRIEPTDWAAETSGYFRSDAALEWLKQEVHRFRDFIAMSANRYSPELSVVMLQDGGELCDKPLTDLPDEVWSDFQRSFLDVN